MKKYTHIVILFLLTLVPVLIGAQESDTHPYTVRSTMIGVGQSRILDTYLSPIEYKGPDIRIIRENMRLTQWMDGRISAQNWLQANISYADNLAKTGTMLYGLVNWSYALHYQFLVSPALKILVGPATDLNIGFLYNSRNSNNPAQAKAYFNLMASAMAIYKISIKDFPLTLRYQVNAPFMGIMFSPEYGESYYEIFSLKHGGRNVLFTSLHNQPSLKQLFTVDIPIRKFTLRTGYQCDLLQANVNNLKSHTFTHSFLIGFVKTFYMKKSNNKAHLSPYSTPF